MPRFMMLPSYRMSVSVSHLCLGFPLIKNFSKHQSLQSGVFVTGHKLKDLTQGINEQTVEYSIIIGKDNSEVRHSRVNPILGHLE